MMPGAVNVLDAIGDGSISYHRDNWDQVQGSFAMEPRTQGRLEDRLASNWAAGMARLAVGRSAQVQLHLGQLPAELHIAV